MIDISAGELVILIGAAAILLGKKEVPQLARLAGRGTGKMVAILNTAREQFTKATQDTGLSELHNEVRQNMYELKSIRSEVRSAGLSQTALGTARYKPRVSPSASSTVPSLAPALTGMLSSKPTPSTSSLSQQQQQQQQQPEGPVPSRTAGGNRLGELAMAELLMQEPEKEAAAIIRGHPSSVAPSSFSPSAREGKTQREDRLGELAMAELLMQETEKEAAARITRHPSSVASSLHPQQEKVGPKRQEKGQW